MINITPTVTQEVNVVLSLWWLVEVANVRDVAAQEESRTGFAIEDALVLWDDLVNLAVALSALARLNLVQAAKGSSGSTSGQ